MKSHYLHGILFILLLPISLKAQEAAPDENQSGRHTVFLEALGNNGYGSLNYEYRFAQKGRWGIAMRGGGYYVPGRVVYLFEDMINSDGYERYLAGNIGLNVVQGKGPHYIEFGPGIGLNTVSGNAQLFCATDPPDQPGWSESIRNYRDHYYLFNFRLGYRFQPLDRGFFFNTSFMAMHLRYRDGLRFWDGSTDWYYSSTMSLPFFSMGFGYSFR